MPITPHRISQLAADAGLIALAWYMAFELRFGPHWPGYYDTLFRRTILMVVGIQLVVFVLSGFYSRCWPYVSARHIWAEARGLTIAALASSLTIYFFSPVAQVRLPRWIAVLDWVLLLGLAPGTRLLARTVIDPPRTGIVARGKEVRVGAADDAGQLAGRELKPNTIAMQAGRHSVVAIFLVVFVVAFPEAHRTYGALHLSWVNLLTSGSIREIINQVRTPGAGEYVIMPLAQAALRLLRTQHLHGVPRNERVYITEYRISSLASQNIEFRQRVIEGAYPIRYNDAAHYVLQLPSEALGPGCFHSASAPGIDLVHCP